MHSVIGLAAALAAAFAAPSSAQPYPSKPLRWVVPFPPGGSADILGRMVGQELAKPLGQSVVIENRPGASAIVGAEYVARAAADGYTLLQGNVGQLTVHPSLYSRLPYDPLRDFAPITVLARVTSVLVVTPSLPVKDVAELVALAKRRPGQLNFTASGAGTTTHLTGELLKQRAGIDMVFINYKGGAPALADVMAGFVEVMVEGLPSALQFIKAGKLKALAVTSKTRSPVLPEVPTLDASGYPGFDMVSWQGLLAPAGTPPAAVERLNAEVVKVLKQPEIRDKIAGLGAEAVGNSPAEFARYLREETEKWGKVVRTAGIKLQP
jgi:tripartite-type tricarboxylate transporter receptor subunit TctC